MVSVCGVAPTTSDAGENVVMAGTGLFATTEKFTGADAPPPGVGFVTITG